MHKDLNTSLAQRALFRQLSLPWPYKYYTSTNILWRLSLWWRWIQTRGSIRADSYTHRGQSHIQTHLVVHVLKRKPQEALIGCSHADDRNPRTRFLTRLEDFQSTSESSKNKSVLSARLLWISLTLFSWDILGCKAHSGVFIVQIKIKKKSGEWCANRITEEEMHRSVIRGEQRRVHSFEIPKLEGRRTANWVLLKH